MTFDFDNLSGLLLAFIVGLLIGRFTAPGARASRLQRQQDQRRHVATLIAGLNPELTAELRALIAERQTIEAIRRVRQEIGLGLKEAKAVVDALQGTSAS